MSNQKNSNGSGTDNNNSTAVTNQSSTSAIGSSNTTTTIGTDGRKESSVGLTGETTSTTNHRSVPNRGKTIGENVQCSNFSKVPPAPSSLHEKLDHNVFQQQHCHPVHTDDVEKLEQQNTDSSSREGCATAKTTSNDSLDNNLINQEDGCNINLREDVSSIDSRTFDFDSNSQGSSTSSNPFADPPLLADVGDDLSELSDLELNFDGPIEWTDGDLISSHPALANQALRSGAPLQLDSAAAKLLLYQGDKSDLKSVDPRTQARLEALLEAAGIGKLSTTDGKAFADPEVLRKLTSSVSCALDEAAASLTRMRAENQTNDLQSSRTLAEACSDGDIEAVKRLLDEGRSVHETNDEGESLLSLACSSGYYELADVLLRMRANVEDRGRKGDCTPLMEAASSGYTDVTKLLITYQADVNAQSSAGHTALHHAAVGGYETVVQLLIDAGANVEQQNENGHTPLMESASAGHVGVAKILLNAGAGINTHSNEFKESALTLACYKGHLDMVKFLLDAGADQEHKTDEMHTALMEASMDGHVEVARLLLDSGAQVNMPIDSFESPLTLAACGGHVELAGLLLERGAKMEEVNDEGYTALMEASREGHEDMVGLLLTHGAQVNTQTDETQETALTLACCGGFMEVASALISNNADIELGCSTPLMEASQEGHLDLVNYLITKDSDVHALTATNDTALTYACENGHTDVADVLLSADAKLENESEGGRTPLMKAARAGHLCTVQFLISKGAAVNRCTTNNEHTVLSLACAGGHLGVVELLLEHGADPMHKLKDGSTMLIEAAKGGHTNVVNLLLDYPNGAHKSVVAVSSEYIDSIPMADDLPPDPTNHKDLSLKSTESLASRLEQFIHKMMSQADNSSGTREEQMARKQEILEELQRVEQELKFRTQIAQQESTRSSPDEQSTAALSAFPTNITPSHEFVEQELQQKQQAIVEQQRHEAQLQQQKEYYQAKLQHLKQQYQEKQLQLQQQRQQLLSQAASTNNASSTQESGDESSKRQPIPLHIALQNHLHAHHVTEGNVNDLAQALQEWDTRDRNINLPPSQVKPMPAFNLNSRPEDTIGMDPTMTDMPLHIEDLSFNDTPPSRSLAHSLATLIQGMDSNSNNFDPTLERAIDSTSSLERPSSEYEMTFKTLEWLKMVDESCGSDESLEPKKPSLSIGALSKPVAKKSNEGQEKQTNTKITKVLNGYVEPTLPAVDGLATAAGRSAVVPPNPPRSASPLRLPFVDPNAETDSNHDTALTLACAGGHSELVKLLLSHSAEIEHRDKKGFTPLILASTAGHSEVVEILIDQGADIEAQSERTKDTPLSLACSGGRYEVVEILLRLGANKEHRNVSDYTPLSLAASGGYVNIIKLLLSYGAEINSRTGSKLGISPLMLAAMNGHTAAVKLLLDMGSDINAQIETNRNTALTLACFQGRHDVVSLLVDRKANIEHRAKTGLTPLMEAASGGYVEVGRVLLDKSADVNAPPVPSSKDTALTIAADKGHYRFVDLLLKRCAAVDVKNKKGNSPLWLACNGGHLDVVQLLVNNNADIDSQDNRRVSSLMTAFRKGHIKVVKWLVKQVNQFPSDQECARYIATVSDKELLKKCQQCMGIIVQAKEQQAREALKNASILLEQIESEKSREERRREAAARKREKKKQKRKEKQAENQTDKVSPEPERSPTPEQPASLSPPPEPANVENIKDGNESVQSKNNANKGRLSNDEDKGLNSNESRDGDAVHIIGKENVATKRTRRNKEKGGHHADSQNAGKKTANREAVKAVASSSRITELDDFGDVPSLPNGSKGRQPKRLASGVSQLDSFEGNYTSKSPLKSTPSKVGVSPSPGKKKREDGGSDWKQVTNKKSKRVSIPSRAASHLSKSLHSIKDKSGAHLEFEKTDKKSSDRTLIMRGSAEAIRNAQGQVSAILREPHTETSGQTNKKSAVASLSGSTSSQSSTRDSRDTLSNVGTFKISDYISATQAPPVADAKVKVIQSKPGWAVRPPPAVSQSAWGVPSGDHLAATTTQSSVNSSAANKAPSLRMPSQVKHPTDVSRQLFPDARAADNKLRVVSASSEPAENQHSAGHSPVSSQLPVHIQSTSQPGFVAAPYIQPSAPAPLVPKVAPPNSSQIGHPTTYYTSFDNQTSIAVATTLPNAYHVSSLDRVNQDGVRNLAHASKAPGFRSAQPQFFDAGGFSKAPGSRAGPMFSNEQMMHGPNSALLNPNMDGDPSQMMGVNMAFPDARKASSLLLRDQYTTRDQPMTLPRISSSLNPNASEFTAPPRFASNGAQHSPRTNLSHHQSASPVDMRPGTPGYQPQSRAKSVNEQELLRQMMQCSSASVSPSMMSGQKGTQQHGLSAQSLPPTGQLLLAAAEPGVGQNQLTSSPPSDNGDRGSMRPIGGERFLFSQSSDIWGSSKLNNDTEWGMKMPMTGPSGQSPAPPVGDPALLAMFKQDDPMANQFPFYNTGNLGAGSGDGIHATWNGSPSKPGQMWPWEQPHNQ